MPTDPGRLRRYNSFVQPKSQDELVANVAAILFGLCLIITSGVVLASTL